MSASLPVLGWNHIVFLLEGAAWTIALSVLAFASGGSAGLLIALARISPLRAVRTVTGLYIQLIQGMPLLILMFLSYFGLSIAGLELPGIVAVTISMTLYVSAYLGEIWRGCLQAVPKTQWEAADCLGLSRTQRMFKVVMPQALRIATPSTVGFMVQIVKNTSLASVIGFVELAQAGKLVNNSTFQPFLCFVVVAAMYFMLCYPLSLWSKTLERKLNVGRR